jgi:hypothetical protein
VGISSGHKSEKYWFQKFRQMQQEKEINLTLEIAAIFSLNDSYLLGTRCNYND